MIHETLSVFYPKSVLCGAMITKDSAFDGFSQVQVYLWSDKLLLAKLVAWISVNCPQLLMVNYQMTQAMKL